MSDTPFEGGGFIVPVRGTDAEKSAARRYVSRQACRLGATPAQLVEVWLMLGLDQDVAA